MENNLNEINKKLEMFKKKFLFFKLKFNFFLNLMKKAF
jgi:hypothetical protein